MLKGITEEPTRAVRTNQEAHRKTAGTLMEPDNQSLHSCSEHQPGVLGDSSIWKKGHLHAYTSICSFITRDFEPAHAEETQMHNPEWWEG